MTTSTNKNFQEPNSASLNWDAPLNSNFLAIDQAMGSPFTVYVGTGSSSTTLTANTATQTVNGNPIYWYDAQQLIIQSGTSSGTSNLSANVTITLPNTLTSGTFGGAWIVRNAISSAQQGTYTVTIVGGNGSGAGVTIPNGSSAFIYTDGTNVYFSSTNFASVATTSVTTTTTLGSGVFGSTVFVTSSAAYTITFPTPTGNNGAYFSIYASGITPANVVTLSGSFIVPSQTAVSSISLASYGSNYLYTFLSNGTNWYVFQSPVASNSSGRVSPRVYSAATQSSPWAWNSDPYDQLELTALSTALTISADAGTPVDGQKAIFRIKDNLSIVSFTGTTTTTTLTTTTSVTLVAGSTLTLVSTGAVIGTVTTGGTGTSFAITGGVANTSVAMNATPPGYALTWTTGSAKSFEPVGISLPTVTTPTKITYVGFIYNGAASRWDGVASLTQA